MSMLQHLLLPALLVALVAGIIGCENSFNPKTDFEAKLVVYSVLDRQHQVQLVRLESTYDAEITNPKNPKEKFIIDSARVSIADDRREYLLHDTLIAVPDSNGVPMMKHFWVTRELLPATGRAYTLRASSPGYNAVLASVVYPARPYLSVDKTSDGTGSGSIIVSANNPAGEGPKGYYFRMFLRGYRIVGGQQQLVSVEIPYDQENGVVKYPTPIRVDALWFNRDLLITEFQRSFQDPALHDIHVFFKAWALDVNMYNFFKTVRGFDDPVSVRQDKPDVTNIVNGLGVFGAIASDSLRMAYKDVAN